MSDYKLKTKNNQPTVRPAQAYPELVKALAHASALSRELHDILNMSSLANDLGITKQSFQKHVNKAKENK